MGNNHEFYTVKGYQLINQESQLLTPSMEDYLEMIYRSITNEGHIRIKRLSNLLNVKPSSSTKMVQKLTALGLINYQKYGSIVLTDEGKELGAFLLNRHNIIQKFLDNIGIEENLLEETELIEHNVNTNTLKYINKLNMFFEKNEEFKKEFNRFMDNESHDG